MNFKLASVCSGVLILLGIAAANVCGSQREGIEQDIYPRTLEMLDVGYQLPIEIVAVRNLQKKEHWIRDLEIEIKNVSAKPIYGVWLTLFLPDDMAKSGAPSAVDLQYGRLELLQPGAHAVADDKSIGSGATVILRVVEQLGRGLEEHLKRESVPEAATERVRAMIVAVSFGDGTGFINCGVPYPERPARHLRPQRYVRIALDS